MVDDPRTKDNQKPNHRVAIALYSNSSELTGPLVNSLPVTFIQDDKVVELNDMLFLVG